MTSPLERASLEISSKQASCAVETRKGLHLNDYGAYLRAEDELNHLILSTLRDGPLKQAEIIKRVHGVRSHVQRHLDELIAQGSVAFLNLPGVRRLYFLPLDVSKSNSWDHEKQLYKRSRTPKEGGRSKRFTYLRPRISRINIDLD